MICPNKNHPSYKLLSQYFTEEEVYQIFINNQYELPDINTVKGLINNIKDLSQISLQPKPQTEQQQAKIEAFLANENTFIKELGVGGTDQLVQHIYNSAVSRLESESYEDIMVNTKADFVFKRNKMLALGEKAKAAGQLSGERLVAFEKGIKRYDAVIENWGVIEELVDNQIKLTKGLIEVDEDNNVDNQIKDNTWDKEAWEVDPKSKVSAKLKLFLSGIKRPNERALSKAKANFVQDLVSKGMSEEEAMKRAEKKTDAVLLESLDEKERYNLTWFGEAELIPFHEVYKNVMAELAGKDESIETLVNVLKQQYNDNLWAKQVVDKLLAADKQTQTQFAVEVPKHQLEMRYVQISKKKKKIDGKTVEFYQTYVRRSNQNELAAMLHENWENDFKLTNLLVSDNNGDYNFNKEAVDALYRRYDEIMETKSISFDTIKEMYEAIGISLSDKTINQLLRRGNGAFREFVYVRDYISDNIGKKYYNDNVQPLNQTAVKSLAKLESRYNPLKAFAPDNFRTQSKQIYSYTAKNFLTDRLNELKTESLRRELKRTWFSGSSQLLAMLEGDSEIAGKWQEAFETVEDLDLQVIKDMQSTVNPGDQRFTRIDEIAQEQAALSFFVNSNTKYTNGNRIARFIFPTFSDKTRSAVVPMPAKKVAYDYVNHTVNDAVVDELYERVVMPEIKRIANYYHIDGAGANFKEFSFGGNFFYFFPELNTLTSNGQFITNIIKSQVEQLGRNPSDIAEFQLLEGVDEIIKQAIKENINGQIQSKLATWKEYELLDETSAQFDINYLEQLLGTSIETKANLEKAIELFAADYKVNDIIAKAEMHFLFIGDPASMAKKSRNFKEITSKIENNDATLDVSAFMEETSTNIGKRLALEIATGKKVSDNRTDSYIQLMLKDPVVHSNTVGYLSLVLDGKNFDLDYYNSLSESEKGKYAEQFPNAANFLDIEGADAQEYTTVREFFTNLIKLGQSSLTLNDVNKLIEIERKANPTTEELDFLRNTIMNTMMQPQKPVYSGQVFDEQTSSMRIVYVKSSAFPLSKHFTKDFELDKLRQVVEAIETSLDKPVRASYSTANKLGSVAKPLQIFNSDGTVKEVDEILDTWNKGVIGGIPSHLELPRKHFKIQQENPVKTKGYIKRGTQETKLLWLNLLANPKVKELYIQYLDEYDTIYQSNKEELLKELGLNPNLSIDNQKVNIKALQKLLLKEARERGYPLQDIKGLDIVGGKFVMPLWLHASSDRYESLLNSIINNRILGIKMPGNSYILGSAEGFKLREVEEYPIPSGTVFTSNFTGELTNSHFIEKATGKVINKPFESYPEDSLEFVPAKVLVPSKFKVDGKIINIRDYAIEKDGRFYLDETVLPKEALQIFGFRIPTSGQMSMASIEIAGFLPENMGDLIIAPRDFTKQMGSDFDVDKLYTYHYDLEFVDGKYRVKDSGVNRIIELHHKLLSIPSTEVQKQVLAPLSFDVAKEQAKLIDLKGKALTSILDDEYQKYKRIGGSAGKAGTGVYSLAVTFHATLQQIAEMARPVQIIEWVVDEGKMVPQNYSLTISGLTFDGKLGKVKTLSEIRYISDVLAQRQNYSVDNEKEQLMFRLNDNKFTFSFNNFMDEAGFDLVKVDNNGETVEISITDFIRTDAAVLEFVRQRNLGKSEAETLEVITEKFGEPTENWRQELAAPNYAQRLFNRQINPANVFAAFMEGKYYGEQLSKAINAFNTDSAGLGKSLFDNHDKLQKINEVFEEKTFSGIKNILTTTINGIATIHGLNTSKIFDQVFPYDKFQPLFDRIMKASGKSELSVEDRQDIAKDFKKFLFASHVLQDLTEDSNIDSLRKEYFFEVDNDTVKNESLAGYMNKLRKQGLLYQPIFNLMEFIVETNGLPSIIKWNNSSRTESDNRFYYDFLDMFTNNAPLPEYNGKPMTYQRLAQFLVAYAYLEGGIQQGSQFIKYVPIEYLSSFGFSKRLRDINYDDPATFGYNDAFMIQFMQHNPMFVDYKYKPDTIYDVISNANSKNINKLTTFTYDGDVKPPFIRVYNNKSDIENKKVRKKGAVQLYMHIGSENDVENYGKYVRIPVLGIHGMNEYDFDKYGVKKSLVDFYNKDTYSEEAVPRSGIANDIFAMYALNKPNLNTEQILNAVAVNSNNEFHKLLAAFYATKDVADLKTEWADLPNYFGSYNPNTDVVEFSRNYYGYFKQKKNAVPIEENILHEYTHAFTVKTLEKYDNLPEEVQAKIRKLNRLMDIAIEKTLTPEQKVLIPTVKAKLPDVIKGTASYTQQEMELYAFVDVKEFTTAIMTQKEFRQKLNVKSGETTLWERVKRVLSELIQTLLMMEGLNPNSITAEAIGLIIDVADIQMADKVVQEQKAPETIPTQQTSESELDVNKIYSRLGNKTQSENVVIDEVNGRKPAVESNINLTKKNLFTVKPIQSVDKKAVVKASVATQYIGFAEGIEGSSTALYAKQIREQNSKFKIPISKTLNEFLEPFFNSNDESIVEPLAKNLINEDKQILAKSIGGNYKDINQFDWYEAIWSDVGQEEVYYYLKTGNNLEQDIQKEKVNSKLYNEWQNFIKENKDFVDGFYKLPKEIQKEQKKDFDKLKEKNDWYVFELSNLEYDIRKNLLKQEGYLENKTNITSNIVNSGNYSSNDVIFVSIGGKRGNEIVRKEQQDKTIKEALKAIEAGAILITDNKSYVESSDYNEGEKRLAKNLEAKGYNYSETTVDGQTLGVWSKTNLPQQTTLTESPVYSEPVSGNYYKFDLQDGQVVEGYYSQGNTTSWQKMNPKTAKRKYQDITENNPDNYRETTGATDTTDTIDTIEFTEETPVTPKSSSGKTIIVPEGSNASNTPIFETSEAIYLMNDQQQAAYNGIKQFVIDKLATRTNSLGSPVTFTEPLSTPYSGLIPQDMWNNMIGLVGKGGTGKTTLIKKVIEDIASEYSKTNKYRSLKVTYAAPTHNAVTMLQESLGIDSESTEGVKTTAALVSRNQDKTSKRAEKGNPTDELLLLSKEIYEDSLSKGFIAPISSADIIVIDESSMISKQFIEDLLFRFNSEPMSKMPVFIFMGDYRQLPPIESGTKTEFKEGVISATLFSDAAPDKHFELSQVMRSKNAKMHEIFDSVGNQIKEQRRDFNAGRTVKPFNFSSYDAVSNESTSNILVVNNKQTDAMIDDYTTVLALKSNPYEMFWVHYNRLSHPNTQALFKKIRTQYFEKLGITTVPDTAIAGDYVQFKGSLPIKTYSKTEDNISIGTIKPTARLKMLSREPVEFQLSMTPLGKYFRNVSIYGEGAIFYNRQGKKRFLIAGKKGAIKVGNYDALTKTITVSVEATTGNTISAKIPYREYKTIEDGIKGLTRSLDEMFEPSYIGSTHTVQGASIKKVIVGDYNVRINAPNINMRDMESSLYTALTRASEHLIIIKPDAIAITDNQDVFDLGVDMTEPISPVSSSYVEESDIYLPDEDTEYGEKDILESLQPVGLPEIVLDLRKPSKCQ